VAVLGHQGAGKTTLVNSLLEITSDGTGAIGADANLVGEETASSKCLAMVPVFYKDYKINLIDIPGNDDFIFEALGVTRLIKGAILVIDGSKGVEVETIKHFNILKKADIPTFIYLNKMDKDDADYEKSIKEIQEKLGKKALDFTYPIGKKEKFDGFINVVDLKARKYNGKTCEDDIIYEDKKAKAIELHNAISEQVALSDDKLLDKFFAGEELTHDEIHGALLKGVCAGEFAPILVGSATKKIGLHTMLQMFIDYLPSPEDLKPYEGKNADGKLVFRPTSDDEPFSAYVFKTTYNIYNGFTSIVKVNSGTLVAGDTVYCPNTNSIQTPSSLFTLIGEKRVPINKVHAGDIVAIPKLDNVNTGDTICSKDNPITYAPAEYPTAVYFLAVKANSKANEEKLPAILDKIRAEDPCIEVKRNNETKQLLVGGTSETHLTYTIEKIKSKYNIELETSSPKVVYRETITETAEAEGRYIKQTGGSGFYGVVVMRFERNFESDANVFAENVFGGAVPKNFFPAVEKGFYEALEEGSLAGFPVIGVKGTLLDGKYHPVDSNEQAFRMAAIKSFREAYPKCKPTILEPIILMKIHLPQQYVGSVLGNLSNRRAHIVSLEDNIEESLIVALAPEAEIQDYVSQLRTLTQGSGYYNIKFDSYKEVPANLLDDVIKNNSLKQAEKE